MVQAPAFAIAPQRKSFQYSAHYRLDHDYSPFHSSLDSSLKHFYGKVNLQTVLLKKGLLRYENLYLLDHAVVDVWPSVVMVKIPKWIPSQTMTMYQRSPQSFCRFISKKDFLEAVVDYAMLQGHQAQAYPSKHDLTKMVVKSSKADESYTLSPCEFECQCSCPAHKSLLAAFTEDTKMLSLLVESELLRGQLPDKHIFSLWATWGANNFDEYQQKQKEWSASSAAKRYWKDSLRSFGIGLKVTIPGHFDVLHGGKILGTADRRYDHQGNSWWVNQRKISREGSVPGDHICYETAEEAACALAKLCKVIDDGERAKADLFGGGWDSPTERISAPVVTKACSSTQQLKLAFDPFGGFDF